MPRPLALALPALLVAAAAALPTSAQAAPALPTEDAITIASYAGTTAWVDDDDGLAVRSGARTRRLDVSSEALTELDVGPGPTGAPVAVYTRCRPSCDVYLHTLRPGAKELKLDVAARPGVSEHLPTIWRDRVAFVRGGDVLLAPVDNGRAKKVEEGPVEDLELGPNGALAYAAQFASDEGNGETGLVVLDVDRGRKPVWVASNIIGESTAAGFGALTAESRGIYYARLARRGCTIGKRKLGRYDTGRRRATAVTGSTVPLAARMATFPVPATPESEGCGS